MSRSLHKNQTDITNSLISHPSFDDYEIIQKFTQHSFSQALLLKKNGRKLIRKFSSSTNRHKILNQVNWFKGMPKSRVLPQVYDSFCDDTICYIDLEYFSDSIPFFEYIHQNPTPQVIKKFIEILDYINQKIHSNNPAILSYQDSRRYISEKIIAKVEECKIILPHLKEIFEKPTLIINGKEHTNLYPLLNLITSDQKSMDCISLTRPGTIHGDLTIENILISPKSFHIIDPNDENYLLTPLVDYAKLLQSLDSGYEFLDKSTIDENKKGDIQYSTIVSREYMKLRQVLNEETQRLFSSTENMALHFHQAAHFARLLPYKATTHPEKILVFYAELIKKLNLFYDRIKQS